MCPKLIHNLTNQRHILHLLPCLVLRLLSKLGKNFKVGEIEIWPFIQCIRACMCTFLTCRRVHNTLCWPVDIPLHYFTLNKCTLYVYTGKQQRVEIVNRGKLKWGWINWDRTRKLLAWWWFFVGDHSGAMCTRWWRWEKRRRNELMLITPFPSIFLMFTLYTYWYRVTHL